MYLKLYQYLHYAKLDPIFVMYIKKVTQNSKNISGYFNKDFLFFQQKNVPYDCQINVEITDKI